MSIYNAQFKNLVCLGQNFRYIYTLQHDSHSLKRHDAKDRRSSFCVTRLQSSVIHQTSKRRKMQTFSDCKQLASGRSPTRAMQTKIIEYQINEQCAIKALHGFLTAVNR